MAHSAGVVDGRSSENAGAAPATAADGAMRSERTIAYWLGALLVLPLVLPYRFLPLTNFYQDAAAYLLALAGAAWLLHSERCGRMRTLQWPLVAAAPLALSAVLVVQQLLGRIVYLQHFVAAIVALIAAAATMAVAYRVLRPRLAATLTAVTWSILLAALLNALWGIVQLAGYELSGFELLRRLDGQFRVSGLLAQPNQLAVLCVWASIAVFYLRWRARLGAWTAAGLFVLFFVTAAATVSKTAYLLFPAAGLAISLWLRGQNAGRGWWLPALLGVAYIPLATVTADALGTFVGAGALESDRALTGNSTLARLAFARDGWELFLSSPWLGVGWHEFSAARWRLGEPTPIELHADHAHNAVINLLAETGLVGFAAIAVPSLFWLWRVARNAREAEQVVLLALLGVIAVYSLLEFPLWLGHFLVPTALFLGLLETRGVKLTFSPALARLTQAAAAALVIGIIAACVDYARVERVFRSMTQAQQRPYTVQQIAVLSNSTLYRREAEIAFVLSAPVDPLHAALNLGLSERVFFVWPVAQTAFIYASYLLYADRADEARHVVSRTCAWSARECQLLDSLLAAEAARDGAPFEDFHKLAFRTPPVP